MTQGFCWSCHADHPNDTGCGQAKDDRRAAYLAEMRAIPAIKAAADKRAAKHPTVSLTPEEAAK